MKGLLYLLLMVAGFAASGQKQMAKTTNVYDEEGRLQMQIAYNPACSCRTYTEFYPDGKKTCQADFQGRRKRRVH